MFTIVLLIANVAVFLLQQSDPSIMTTYGLLPTPDVVAERFETIMTSGFLHLNMAHLVGNMVSLLYLGLTLERAIGHTRFLMIYVLALLGGSAAVIMFSDPDVLTVGASGAIYGLLGAVAVVSLWQRRLDTGLLGMLAINLVMSFVVPGISWQAHIGGLAVGVVATSVFVLFMQQRRDHDEEQLEAPAAR